MGRKIPLKPIFVFFSPARELMPIFDGLPPDEGSKLKNYFRLEPTKSAVTLRQRLEELHGQVTQSWDTAPQSGPDPL